MSNEQIKQLAEAFTLQTRARQWFADLATAGVAMPTAMAAMQTAIIEVIIANGGKKGAVRWLTHQLEQVDQFGAAIEVELRQEGH
jgi:hypothetical protein